MDEGTKRDYIEDLKIERALLLAEIDQLRELVRSLETEKAHLSESEQRYASDYFRWRKLAERLNGLLRSLEAERDQWQRQAMSHG